MLRCPPGTPAGRPLVRRLATGGLGLLLLPLLAASAVAQSPGEVLIAWVLGTGGDPFGCGKGDTPCNLAYRIYHLGAGSPEVNARLSGIPRSRPRGYQTGTVQSGQFPSASGRWDIPFFVVWDGVVNPGGRDHVGYYGAQSQIVRFGEQGDSATVGCAGGKKAQACFEPLTSSQAHGAPSAGPIGGLSAIPVPRVNSGAGDQVALSWDPARGMTVNDGAPPGVAGYRLFAYRGEGPSDGALNAAALVAETQATRADVPKSHPGLAGARVVTFAIKLVYIGGLESKYFSANSPPLTLDGEGDDGLDFDEDGRPDSDDNCPNTYNPEQEDLDADGFGDACDSTPEGEDDDSEPEREEEPDPGEPADDDADTDPSADGEPSSGEAPAVTPAAPAPAAPATTALPAPPAMNLPPSATGATPADPDHDGLGTGADNCPGFFNPDQRDRDGDGVGDACDPDADGDLTRDDLDCDPEDPQVARPVARGAQMEFLQGTANRLAWAPTGEPARLLRGTLPMAGPFAYDHGCLWSGVPQGTVEVADDPPPGRAFYYLVGLSGGCLDGVPGRDSGGGLRPRGRACLDVALSSAGGDALPWSFAVYGTGEKGVRLDVSLDRSAIPADLYALSLEIRYDPGLVRPSGRARAGSLLEEEGSPVRLEGGVDSFGPGRLTLTLSRTGVSGGVVGGGEPGAALLVSTDWDALATGEIPFRVFAARVLDSSFQEIPLASPPDVVTVWTAPTAEPAPQTELRR